LEFLRVVEVLPPLFDASRSKDDRIAADAAMERFTQEVRSIRDCADVILVANVKDTRRLKFDSVHAAVMLQEDFLLETGPVIVVRDQNRPQFLSTVLTAVSLGLNSVMIAWGDEYPASAKASNVRDFQDLAAAIREASLIRSRARAPTRIFAPVDIESLAYPRGMALARKRLSAGGDMLLAQPPTTDAGDVFDRHLSLLENAGLKGKVLPNVFPFKDADDVRRYEKMFGWRLPKGVHETAAKGERELLQLGRKIVRRLRREGFPGVYLTTRGNPGLAEALLS
jgi:5,10-methylenetetrahydrofolate reductase